MTIAETPPSTPTAGAALAGRLLLRLAHLEERRDLYPYQLFCADRVLILSNRPVHLAEEHVIPFGEERDMLKLRARPEFLELYGKLWDGLSKQIARGQADQGSESASAH